MVEQVEEFCSELEFVVLRQRETLEQGAVKLEKTWRDQGVPSQIAEHANWRQDKLAGVDIDVRIAFADGIIVAARNQAGTKIVAIAERIHLSGPVLFNGEGIAGRHREGGVSELLSPLS